jgi:DNA polymerase-3 subunit delta'
LLQKAILDNRIAHAYCFIGEEGAGKEAIAIEFAKIVNCLSPVINDNSIECCNKCGSCKMANSLQHPNIQLIYSLPTPKAGDSSSISDRLSDEQINEIQQQNELKSLNPYHKIQIPKATQIKIASVREIKRNLGLTSNSEGRRIVLVFRADEMNNEAANAFLKTLEEPQSNITIIMTTSKSEVIIPTILSRCQQVHFQSLPIDELAEYLVKKLNIDLTDAKLASNIGQGSYQRAVEFLDENMKLLREEVVDFFRTSLKKAYRTELITKIEPIYNQKDRNKIDLVLNLLLVWLRDAFSIQKSGSKDFVVNVDQVDIIERFVKNFISKDFESTIKIVELAIEQNRRNVNQQLLMINMFINLRNKLLF